MKKKLALLMAAIMTVAMVPMTAFAATSGSVSISATNMRVAVEDQFQSDVELYKKSASATADDSFIVEIQLENGVFSKYGKEDGDWKDEYVNEMPAEAITNNGTAINKTAETDDSRIPANSVYNKTAALYEKV